MISEKGKVGDVDEYVKKSQKRSELERKENKEKTGVFTGLYAINQLTGYEMPVWIADYALMGYGTGAVVGVPGHDRRDFEFAKAHDLKIIRVVVGLDGDESDIESLDQVQEKEGKMVNSQFLNGLDIHEATRKIMDYIVEKGWGEKTITYHIHDWSVSRQRYWGTPVPIIHCPKDGIVPVPEAELPVLLPYDVDFQPKGKPPLASNEEWLKVKCPKCGGSAKREAETMDTFVDSSWYFFRFLDPNLETGVFDIDLCKKIMPVDIYFGGAEHTLGHTLYSRFFTKFFHDLILTDLEEYALRRINHGTILGPDGSKMSKSRPESVVNPDEEVKKYGADTIRLYLAFLMPYEATGAWDRERVNGPYRFLQRVWGLKEKIGDLSLSEPDLREMNRTIKAVSEDLEAIKFNTAVARLMEWLNYLSSKEKVARQEYKNLLLLLAPFAPHIAEELWQFLVNSEEGRENSENSWSVHQQSWPEFDEKYLEDPETIIVVQVNGKVRDQFKLSKNITEKEVLEMAKKSEKVSKFLKGEMGASREIKKTVFIPGKLLNIVN
ncbi:leucine--tRNA ligase [Candidatus Daviesbacteria bacterium]|nr:leucine--tRNA ligase [Candidatus Daviesbacteria bacterium]